ncbi:mitochondrial import inner membrane translocase subunit TIM21 [Trichoderma gamsii]|uniref:Mitochondrial import inner membrane translocase subunit Tim21 n=1 Tax=Trichoderma gamsii TaxID=398673 RepID=A0A2P4ZYT2_9HYPO|nr:mitochondrial import inner membrane translocase subunit TIM21 [Trichoderma gamsii]PON29450.1 mitochondrial import inner membrane translocase subunit TIM21 [Trichoderma gamsii]
MMTPTTTVPAIRVANSTIRQTTRLLFARTYATQTGLGAAATPKPKRRSVTPFNDTGFVPWSELSAAEKAARATQQSYNFGMIIVGLVATCGVAYFLWSDVFSPESKTRQFNRAVDKIKKDHRCLELLGDANKISAHGDETFNKWRRARPITSTERTDGQGNQHLMMQFYVEGPKGNGVVQCHMVIPRGESEYDYKYLFVDVKGHERIYLENADTANARAGKKPVSFFGVKWG